MAAARVRNADAIPGRSGGQESEALMVFLASVKEECKPPVYSAFISLMNAYHGNMLAVGALLDELFALFSPRVHLLAGIKPLVDKSHHLRIDELCGKVRGDPGFVSSVISNHTNDSNNSNGLVGSDCCGNYENDIDTGLGGLLESTGILHSTNNGSANGSTLDVQQQKQPLLSTPNLGGSGGSPDGTRPQSISPHPHEGVIVKESGSPAISPSGSNSGSGGSRAASAGGGLSGGRTTPPGSNGNHGQGQLALGSPSSQLLTEQDAVTLTAQELMSDVDGGVDHALLDFMMCDSPAAGPSESPHEPPSILSSTPAPSSQQPQLVPHNKSLPNHQQHQQRQQQRRKQYRQQNGSNPAWSSSPSPALSATHSRQASASSNNNGSANGDTTTGTSSAPDNGSGGGSNGRFSQQSGYQTSPNWHRSESAPNLQLSLSNGGVRGQKQQQQQQQQQHACRIHSMQTPGCRDCQGNARTSTPTLIRRSSLSSAAPGGGGMVGTSPASHQNLTRRHNSVPALQNPSNYGNRDVHGGATSGRNGSMDLDAAGFLGLGKRVWEERGVSTPSSSSAGGMGARGAAASHENSHFFPSAAVNGRTSSAPSRPHMKRRISVEPTAAGIEDERRSPGVSGTDTPNVVASATGGAGSGHYRNGSPTDSNTLSSEFAGIGSARAMSDDGFSRGGGGRGLGAGMRGAVGNSSDLEKLVLNVATKGMQQALQYGLRHTFTQILHKKDREIAELKEEALRWSANDTRLRQINQQLMTETMQLRQIIEQSIPPSSS